MFVYALSTFKISLDASNPIFNVGMVLKFSRPMTSISIIASFHRSRDAVSFAFVRGLLSPTIK
jgi:hypothetical protein